MNKTAIFSVFFLLAAPAWAGSGGGGPDSGGYSWVDSDEPNGATFEWSEPGPGALNLELVDDQTVPFEFPAGFRFNYYGEEYSQIHICSNGWVTFVPTGSNTFSPGGPLPDNTDPRGMLAVAFTDLYPVNIRGSDQPERGVWVEVQDDSELVVTWRAPYYAGRSDGPYVEAQLRLTEPDIIDINYRQIPATASTVSVGLENSDNLDGVSQWFAPIPGTANNYAIHWSYDPANVNHPPEFVDLGDHAGLVGSLVQFTVRATDEDGDDLTYRMSALDGAEFNTNSGLFRWTPQPGQDGTHLVTFTVMDNGEPNLSAEQTITISIDQPNSPPVVTSEAPDRATVGEQYVYQIEANDPDGDTIRYSARQLPEGASVSLVTGLVTWVPGDQYEGQTVEFRVILRDDNGGVVTHIFQVAVGEDAPPPNSPPVFTSTPPATATAGVQYIYDADAVDPDGDPIVYSRRPNRCPNGSVIDAGTGIFRYTPTLDQIGETFSCSIRATDSNNLFNVQVITVSVQPEPPPPNEPPRFNSQPPTVAVVGGLYSYAAEAVDPEGTTVTYSLDQGPEGSSVMSNSGLVRWDPRPAQAGNRYQFVLIAEDADNFQGNQTWFVDVDDQPNNRPIVTSNPRTEAYAGLLYQYAILATDPDGDAVSFDLVTSPQGASIDPNGRITWTPGEALGGTLQFFRVRISDNRGATVVHEWNVLVSADPPENQAPVISSTPDTHAEIGQLYSYTILASDGDGDRLDYDLLSHPEGAVLEGTVISWTPSQADDGISRTFVVEVSDGNGGTDRQQWLVVSSLDPGNNPPVFDNSGPTTATVGEVYRHIVEFSDPDGDVVSLRLVGGPDGVALIDDEVTWTPGPSDGGQTRRITLEIIDSRGATARQVIDIEVEVVVANEPPDFTSAPEGTAFLLEEYVYRPQASDPEGGRVTYVLEEAPPGARLDGGLLTWTPQPQDLGRSHGFVVLARDPQGAEAQQRWDVFVDQSIANRAPVIISNAVVTADAEVEYRYQVEAIDPDGDPIFFVFPEEEPPPEGMSIDREEGLVTWTPSLGQEGESHRVVIVAIDPGGLYDAQVFEIGVGIDANNPPKITSTWPNEAILGQQYVYQVVATDLDGDAMRFFVDEDRCPAGMTINMMTGRLTWMPEALLVDTTVTCLLGVVDEADLVDLQTISFRVVDAASENRDPVIVSSPTQTGSAGQLYAYNITASDPDGDSLSYELITAPNGARMITQGPLNGIAWMVPGGTEGEQFSFEIEVSDGNGGSANQAWTVTIGAGGLNQPPVITSNPSLVASPGALYQYEIEAFDLEGQALTYRILSGPAGATVGEDDGNLRWTPTEGQSGQGFGFRIEVQDSGEASAEQTWTVQVGGEPPPPLNRAPTITSEPVTEAEVGVEYRYQAEAVDPDGDPLFWILPEEEEPPQGMEVDAATGLITWTPGADLDGQSVRVTVAVWDGSLWDAQVYQIGVNRPAANHAPRFTSEPPNQATAGELFSYQPTASDEDGDPLFYGFAEEEDCPFEVSNTGEVTWTPSNVLIGQTVSCILVVVDPGELADTQTLSLTVTDGAPANTPPIIISQAQDRVTVGQSYRYDARAEDEDGDSLTWRMTAGPPSAVLDAQTGVLVWTPAPDEVGRTISFAIEVSDGRGGIHRQSWNVNVEDEEPLNDPPIIISTPGETAVALQAYRYEAVAEDPNGDVLSWRLLEAPRDVEINASTGVVLWIPTAGDRGEHVIQIEVSDGQASTRQRWTLTVNEPVGGNNPPAITTNPKTRVYLGSSLSQNVRADDPDGDPLTWRLVAGPATALLEDRRITWTPALGDLDRSHGFSVEVSDGRGGMDSLTWEVEVPNRAPEISSDPPLEAQSRQSYSYRASASDNDGGDILTWTLESAPDGMAVDPQTGRIQWVPTDEQGSNSYLVVLVVTDSVGAEDRQSWELGVDEDPGNRAPVIRSRPETSVVAGEVYLYQVEAEDDDEDRLTYSLDADDHPAGMSIDPASGLVRWNAPLGLGGESVSFTVRVDDGNGLFDEQQTLLAVENPAINQAPTFGREPAAEATVGELYEFRPRARDPEGDAYTVTLIQGPPSASCSDNRCNTLSWLPTDTGRYSFKLLAEDSEGNISELAWEVVVSDPEPNGLPFFTSSPEPVARVGELYEYGAEADDPDDDELSYSLAVSPPGMTIDEESGEIRWQPTRQDLGFQQIVVQVSDGKGGVATQEYQLGVIDEGENAAPEISSEPGTEAYPTLQYSYQVVAEDADGDPLVFELKESPETMVIDEQQLITWTPSSEQAGSTHRVVLEVSDGPLTDSQIWEITVAEEIPDGPIADAGLDQEVEPGTVELDGSNSRDPYGGVLSYEWSLIEGPDEVEISAANQAIASVDLRRFGAYRFKLLVAATSEEGEVLTDEDEVVINVLYNGPIADAGPDTRVSLSSAEGRRTVALDGTASVYRETPTNFSTFIWIQIDGPEVEIEAPESLRPTFTATEAGSYGFRLTISEEGFQSSSDSVVISVSDDSSSSSTGEFAVPESACGCAGSSPWDLGLWAFMGLLVLRRRRLT